jgi:predicted RNase H-like nuclease (RuvC/YqgF family)
MKLPDDVMVILMKQDIKALHIRNGELLSEIDELRDKIDDLLKLTNGEMAILSQSLHYNQMVKTISSLNKQLEMKQKKIRELKNERDYYMSKSLCHV